MKKLFVLIFYLFLFQVNVGWGQMDSDFNYNNNFTSSVPWIRQLPTNGGAVGVVNANDGGFITCTGSEGNINFCKYSEEGEFLWIKSIPIPESEKIGGEKELHSINKFIPIEDGYLFGGGVMYDNMFLKINNQGDTLFCRVFDQATNGQIVSVIEIDDVYALFLWGNNNTPAYFKLYSKDGVFIENFYLSSVELGSMAYLYHISDDRFLIGGYDNYYYFFDYNFNLLNSYYSENTRLFLLRQMGGYISISNDGGSYTQNNWHNDSLIRFDENFNVIWKKPVLDYFTPYSQGYFQIRNLIETPENDIIFSGAFGREDYHRNFWVKVDENGNLIWTYTLAANANAHSVHGTIYRPDGIVMLQAEQPYQVSDNYGNMLWLVKTRPDGTLANEELETNTTINISPNPANENITISFPEIFSGTIEIFNLQGQKVFDTQTENIQQTTINISNLPEGFYLLKTFNNPNNTIATTKFIVN